MSRSIHPEKEPEAIPWEELPESRREAHKQRSEYDTDTLRYLREDIDTTLDNHLQAIPVVQQKAVQIMRVNGVVLTILLAASSQVANASTYLNPVTLSGGGLLIGSIFTSIAAYRSPAATVGIGPEDVSDILDSKLSEREYLLTIAQAKSKWTEDLAAQSERKGNMVTASIVAFGTGIVLILAGVGFVVELAPHLLASILIGIVAVFVLSWVISLYRRKHEYGT